MAKLSKYEIEREANIARNRAILEQLELKQAMDSLKFTKSISKSASTSKAKPVQSRVKRERAEVVLPRRQSARIRRGTIDPNETAAERRKREKEMSKWEREEESALLDAEERARAAKRPRHHDVNLISLAENGPEDYSTLSSTLKTVSKKSISLVADEELGFYDNADTRDVALKDLRENLENLQIVSRARVTEGRVYSTVYHPDVSKDLIFFGDKRGTLGIWDAQAPLDNDDDDDDDYGQGVDNREGGKYWRLQVHWPATSNSSISSIKLDPIDAHNVYTSSYDCTVRAISFTTGVSREIYASRVSDKQLLTSIDLAPNGREMWISDSNGGAAHIDLREPSTKARHYELSAQKIGCISINPTNPHFLLTASNSRVLKIWDVRNLGSMVKMFDDDDDKTLASEEVKGSGESQTVNFDSEIVTQFLESKKGHSVLRGEWEHNKSVSSAYWDPRGRKIVSTSYDNMLRVWDLEPKNFSSKEPFGSMKPLTSISHNCQSGQWVTVLRAQWSPNPNVYPHFVVAAMDHSLNLYSYRGELITRLADKQRITAVQAVACLHPSNIQRAASGNGSGRCVLWAPKEV